ncbi:MAG: hypothetical protein HY475_02605 [Candidatus Terrybacteria bacterium]|nr:hypothetical protein [Candidatus Terrybacteria bacterium]
MAVSITPERMQSRGSAPSVFAIRTSGDLLFFASAVFLAMVFVSWLGVAFLTTRTRVAVENLETERVALAQDRSAAAEETLLAAVVRTTHLTQLVRGHRDGREAFRLLEQRVQPNVTLTNFLVDYSKATITTTMSASSFTAIAQQLLAFEQDPRVAGIRSTEFLRSTDTGLFTAAVELTLRPDAFRLTSSR